MARFQDNVQLQPVVGSSGAAQGAMSLSDRLEAFKSLSSTVTQMGAQKYRKQAVKKGVKSAGAVELVKKGGVTQAPELKETTFFGGIEAKAHNNAIKAAYLASLNNDIRTHVSRIEAENNDNLIGFNEALNGWAKGLVSEVDPSIKSQTQEKINDISTAARINVQNNSIAKQNKEAALELSQSADTALNDALRFSSNGDLESALSGIIDYVEVLTEQEKAGFLSKKEKAEKIRTAELRATHENLVGTVRRIANGGKAVDAIEIIDNAQQTIPKGMTVDEHQDLTRAMITELNEGVNNRLREEKKELADTKKMQSQNYSNLSIGITNGTTNTNEITRNLRDGKITEQQFDKLITTINNRGFGVDSYPLINSINEDIRNGADLETTRNSIISNSGVNLTEATAQSLLTRIDSAEDKEFVLNTNTVRRARDFITPSIRVTGPLGALDTEAEFRLASSIREFDTRVLEGEDPWVVADELVGKDRLERLPDPMFGTKTDTAKALKELNEAAINKTIDKETYLHELDNINTIKQLRANIDAFDTAKKEIEVNNANGIR